jgi:hypothetical protein
MITNDAGRARKGGETGMNGEFYKGGTFLPSTEAPKGTHTVSWRERDPLTAEQLAKIAQQEAEVAERKAKNAAIALEPHNAWLISWLEGYSRVGNYVWGSSSWYDVQWLSDDEDRRFWRNPENLAAGLADGRVQQRREFGSGFLGDMYNNLALYGYRPVELSDRQYGTLCEIWVKEKGARRGSKRWNALCEEFYDNTLPNEIEEEK